MYEGQHMRKGIKRSVLQRVNTNRTRIAEAREREEREAAAIRALKEAEKHDKAA